jgi:hypothetical protein
MSASCTRSETPAEQNSGLIASRLVAHVMRTTAPSGGPHDHPAHRETTVNHSVRIMRRPRQAWPPTTRTVAAIITAGALALLAAACSGSPSSTSSGGSSNAGGSANSKALLFARCVRAHGVPGFPDPNSAGQFNKTAMQQLATSNSRYQAATQTCGHLLPNSGGGPSQAEVRQEWNGMASFARCIRSHGVPNWPDPTPYPPDPERATFILPASIQPVPPTISKVEVCLRLVPNNEVVGHIDNDNWQAAQEAMAGQ